MANEFALSADGRIYQLSHRLGIIRPTSQVGCCMIGEAS